jgi:hypothetical protein
MSGCRLDSDDSRQGPVADSSGHSNEISGSIKGMKSLSIQAANGVSMRSLLTKRNLYFFSLLPVFEKKIKVGL